jgi:hypothetical protein
MQKECFFKFIFTFILLNQLLFLNFLRTQESDLLNFQDVPLTIKPYSYLNRLSLNHDINIKTRELTHLNYILNLIDYRDIFLQLIIDINILIEIVIRELFPDNDRLFKEKASEIFPQLFIRIF